MSLAFLTVFLTACASNRPVIEPCDQPELRGETWADVAILAVEQKAAIEVCNARIQAVR